MKKWSVQRLLTMTHPLLRTSVLLGIATCSLVLLSGCHGRGSTNRVTTMAQSVIPDIKVVDYRTASCDTIWFNEDSDALSNALYWLRVMDCADRLTTEQARIQARALGAETWVNVLKQSLLLNSAEPSAAERRQILARLDGYRTQLPSLLRPLLQLWRERQMLTISLQEEKGRYQRLQESTDAQLDTMRENQNRLQYRLDDTTRKLENLTDIERQLSSRKQMQGEMQDSSQGSKSEEHSSDKPAGVKPSAPETTSDTAPIKNKEH